MVLIRPDSIDTKRWGVYKGKTAKRSLHFCDGILDEYDTDEEAEALAREAQEPQSDVVDVATLTWGPWLLYKTWAAGSSTLNVIDYIGETIASILGITTSKYYFELEEYKRRTTEAREMQEMKKGWSEPNDAVVNMPLNPGNNEESTNIRITQPHPSKV